MLFESTTILLRTIVQTLENSAEPRWDDHLECGRQCLFELHQMSHSSVQCHRADSNGKSQAHVPALDRSTRAIPHVKAMLRCIREREQAAAIQSGKAAISEMCGVRTELPVVPTVESNGNGTEEVIKRTNAGATLPRQNKSASQARAALMKRKPARTSAASTQ
jgi:hypothetical protein